MEGHRTAERRSVAYHRAIAGRLADPAVLEPARARVQAWEQSNGVAVFYRDAWRRVLAGSVTEIAAALVDESEHMTALRQVSPFAGVLDPRTRWKIWRSVA